MTLLLEAEVTATTEEGPRPTNATVLEIGESLLIQTSQSGTSEAPKIPADNACANEPRQRMVPRRVQTSSSTLPKIEKGFFVVTNSTVIEAARTVQMKAKPGIVLLKSSQSGIMRRNRK